MSTPPADVAFVMKFNSLSSRGVLETKFTSPAMAAPPYNVEAEPLITSTCFKADGAI